MHKDLKLSLKNLNDFSDDVPGIGNFANRMLAETYEKFISVLYDDIDKIVARMEENPELRKDDGEDRLTIEIINQLCAMGYDASHETKIGGHADLVVKNQTKGWIWIGEAKIHNGYAWLLKGFNQLTTRYSTGNDNNCQGGLLIYIRNIDAKNVMNKWQTHLKENIEGIKIMPCPNNSLSFYSTHNHQRTGLEFKVRHIPLVLSFKPQDK